jgi:uncharacterized membrane protein YgaE (UPF0421/DUF939 family)
MPKLKKIIGYRTLKTAVGAILAVFISQLLHLDYAANSGIIVILSVQATKKRSKDLAIMRIGSTFLALTIGTIVFSLFGFNAIAFGIYLLIFIPIAVKLKFHDGIVPCSVLVTHLLAIESVAPPALINELLQMLIGAGIGFLLNLYMPSLEKQLDEDIHKIDLLIKSVISNMADKLRDNSVPFNDIDFNAIEVKLNEGYEKAWREFDNRISNEITYHIKYMEARIVQFEILKHMRRYFKRLKVKSVYDGLVADLTQTIANRLDGLYDEDELFDIIASYRLMFKELPLPSTRQEFEVRAALYEYVNDLEHFLESKDTILHTLGAHSA